MARLHLHLLSDSTGETLEMLAKAALAQFGDADVQRHFWPMVRSVQHLERIIDDFKTNPGLVLYTLSNEATRKRLEECCRQLALPHVAALDPVVEALEERLGQEAHGRPGGKNKMDAEYFERVDAIQSPLPMTTASAGTTGKRPISCWRAFPAPRKRRRASTLRTVATRWPIFPWWWKARRRRCCSDCAIPWWWA